MPLLNGLCVCLVPDDWSRTPSRWSQLGPFLLTRSCAGCEYMRRYMYSAPCQPCTKPFVSLFYLWFMLTSVFHFLSLSPSLTLVPCKSVSVWVFFLSGTFLRRDLSNNQISELASDAFQGLRSLNSLWVMCDMFVFQMCTWNLNNISALWISWKNNNHLPVPKSL